MWFAEDIELVEQGLGKGVGGLQVDGPKMALPQSQGNYRQ